MPVESLYLSADSSIARLCGTPFAKPQGVPHNASILYGEIKRAFPAIVLDSTGGIDYHTRPERGLSRNALFGSHRFFQNFTSCEHS